MKFIIRLVIVVSVLAMSVPVFAEYGGWTLMHSEANYNNALIGISAPTYDDVFSVGAWTNGIDTYRFIWRSTDGGENIECIYDLVLSLAPENLCDMLKITYARTSLFMTTDQVGMFGGSGVDPECIEQFPPEPGAQATCIFVCSLTLQPSVWLTDDGGDSFFYADCPTSDNFGTVQTIFMVNDFVGYAAGLASYLIKTVDGGENWTALPGIPTNDWYINHLYFINENEGWMAVGTWDEGKKDMHEMEGAELVRTQLHRMRLSSDPLYRFEYLSSSAPKDSPKMINGAIMHTIDGGQTWELQKQSGSEGYDWVFFIDKNTGWIVGDSSISGSVIANMYKTTDGGETWTNYLPYLPAEIAGLPQGWIPIGISFRNPKFGMMWGYGPKIISYGAALLYTTDGGETWTADTDASQFQGGQWTFDWVDNTMAYSGGLHLNTMKYEGTNAAPTADAGEDISTEVGAQAMLDGTASSDPDGDGLFYAWTYVSGLEIEMDEADVAQPTFTAEDEGIAIFSLVVNDGMYDSDPDEVEIIVGPATVDDDAADDDVADDDAADDDAADDDVSVDDDDDDDDGCGC